ncbi:MAG: hypothetical protein HY300_02260 [Verrucomicrobia bacterium]|nr:hypothetical protein [Verrucomicrobiota bacterium]
MLIIALFALMGGCVFWTTCRRLVKLQANWHWWLTGAVLSSVGLMLGIQHGLSEYHASPTFRFVGIPIPLVTFHLEDGQWVDFVHDAPVTCLGIGANVLSWMAVAVSPLTFAVLLKGRCDTKQDSQ